LEPRRPALRSYVAPIATRIIIAASLAEGDGHSVSEKQGIAGNTVISIVKINFDWIVKMPREAAIL
jgi:hypothetical protein